MPIYEWYAPSCVCQAQADPVPTKNYAGHEVAPPKCFWCKATWKLVIERVPTFEPKKCLTVPAVAGTLEP